MSEKIRTPRAEPFFCDRCKTTKTSKVKFVWSSGHILCNGCNGYVERFGREVRSD